MTTPTPFLFNEDNIECLTDALHCVTNEYRGASNVDKEDYLIEHEDEIKTQILENQEIVERIRDSLQVLYEDKSGYFVNTSMGLTIDTDAAILLLESILGEQKE